MRKVNGWLMTCSEIFSVRNFLWVIIQSCAVEWEVCRRFEFRPLKGRTVIVQKKREMLSEVKVVADMQAWVSPFAEQAWLLGLNAMRMPLWHVQMLWQTFWHSQLAPCPRPLLLMWPTSFTLHLWPNVLNNLHFNYGSYWLLVNSHLCARSPRVRELVHCSLM